MALLFRVFHRRVMCRGTSPLTKAYKPVCRQVVFFSIAPKNKGLNNKIVQPFSLQAIAVLMLSAF
jgi:hypothetical protein